MENANGPVARRPMLYASRAGLAAEGGGRTKEREREDPEILPQQIPPLTPPENLTLIIALTLQISPETNWPWESTGNELTGRCIGTCEVAGVGIGKGCSLLGARYAVALKVCLYGWGGRRGGKGRGSTFLLNSLSSHR